MTSRLNYYWRLAATGFSFAAFGVGGLALSTLVFPLLLLFPKHSRAQHARWIIHKSFGVFMRLMHVVGVMKFEVIGSDRLSACRDTLVLANHPTLIDVVALISLLPQASCVVKQALWKNPFLGGVVRAAGYVSNVDPENLIHDCSHDLSAGNPLIIFPEGTRSQPGKTLHFLRGAAHIALQSGMPILPVIISCTPSTLTRSEKWHHIPNRRFHLRIEVLPPMQVSQWLVDGEAPTISVRKITRQLETFFTQELASNGHHRTTQHVKA